MLKLEKITGGVLVEKVKTNHFVTTRTAVQNLPLFNSRQQSQKQFISAPVNKRLSNRFVMAVIQSCKTMFGLNNNWQQ